MAISKKPQINLKLRLSPRVRFFLFTSIAVLFILIANSALWVNRTVFNTEKFSEITTSSLLSESSRAAMADEVIDQALSDRPLVKNVVQEPASKLVSGLLATSQAEAGVKKVSAKLQIVLTSENRENVEVDLSGIKQTVVKLIDLAGKEDTSVRVEQIPDRITLLDVSKLPTFYKLGTLFIWVAPLAFVLGFAILATPHVRAKKLKMDLLLSQGLMVLAGYIVGLLFGPLFRPPVLSQFSNANLRIVAENLYNSFVASFNSQIQLLLILGLAMVIVPAVNKMYIFTKKKK